MDRERVHGKWPNCRESFRGMMLTLQRLGLKAFYTAYIDDGRNAFIKKYMA